MPKNRQVHPSESATPRILVIFGISGDLAKKKLLPALRTICQADQLPSNLQIIGVTRQPLTKTKVMAPLVGLPGGPELAEAFQIFQLDTAVSSEYERLKKYLATLNENTEAELLFYLAVPPNIAGVIVEGLGRAGLNEKGAKLLLEKPFGQDLASAKQFIGELHRHFDEDQVYRIDHYLAKEMVQNILLFRASNSVFRHVWHNQAIESIEIMASEKIGIEGRAVFYEQTGALRDILQSHLFQLMALVLMELPTELSWQNIHSARLQALQQIQPIPIDQLTKRVKRAQYQGYTRDVGNLDSSTETFVSVRLFSNDPNWQDVPITLTTGKNLAEKYTEIRVNFRALPSSQANRLVFRIQPHEGTEIDIWAKQPGYERHLKPVKLAFAYETQFAERLPEAYEQVLLDSLRSDKSLFAGADEILVSWQLLQPILDAWQNDQKNLTTYPAGTTAESLSVTD